MVITRRRTRSPGPASPRRRGQTCFAISSGPPTAPRQQARPQGPSASAFPIARAPASRPVRDEVGVNPEGGIPNRANSTARGQLLREVVFLIVLAAIVSAPGIANGFAYDDLPIIRDNPRVHELLAPWTYAAQSYWPPSHGGFLYRPLVVWLFAAEW